MRRSGFGYAGPRTDQPATRPIGGGGPASNSAAARLSHGPGSVLGRRYELRHVIGHGGMATVYRAHDHRLGRDVAIKLFQPVADLVDADQRHHREVELLATLDDPGLVTVLDADLGDSAEEAELPYLVTELVHGSTLSQRLARATLDEKQVAQLGADLGRTLAYIHGRGIVHRDVKPANILLPENADDASTTPKLVDFGIAVVTDRPRLTSDDATVGTANYVSPEQVRGHPVTPASDIYSLGLVLIEALTGTLAYPGSGLEAALARLNRPPTIPRTTSRPLQAVLRSMTAQDARDRPPARRVADELEAIAGTKHTAPLPDDLRRLGPVDGGRRRVRRATGATTRAHRRASAVAGAAAVLAAGATVAGVITAATSTAPDPPRSPSRPAAIPDPSPARSSTPQPGPSRRAVPLRTAPVRVGAAQLGDYPGSGQAEKPAKHDDNGKHQGHRR